MRKGTRVRKGETIARREKERAVIVEQIPREETWEAPETQVAPSGWLSPEQRRFCELVVELGNQTEAYIRAGFNPSSRPIAGSCATNLMKRPQVQEFIARLRERIEERSVVSVEKTLAVIAHQAYGDPGELFNDDGSLRPISEIPLHARHTIEGLEVKTYMERTGENPDGSPKFEEVKVEKVKIAKRLPAARALGEHLGIFEPEGGTKVQVFVVEVPQRAASSEEWARRHAGKAMRRIAGADE